MNWWQTLAICAAIVVLAIDISKAAEFLGRQMQQRTNNLQLSIEGITHALDELKKEIAKSK